MAGLPRRQPRPLHPGCWQPVARILAIYLLCQGAVTAESGPSEEYRTTLRLLWSGLYTEGGETLYCGQPFGPGEREGLNAEHVYPMSWVTRALRCGDREACRRSSTRFNRIESDLHNIFPARIDVNKKRGSFPFGIVKGEARRFGSCDFELDYAGRRAEPRAAVRGDIARAMFYMHDRYGLAIYARQGRLLKQWNRDDPPSTEEKRRNAAIEMLQGNRNPFIDRPESAERLDF